MADGICPMVPSFILYVADLFERLIEPNERKTYMSIKKRNNLFMESGILKHRHIETRYIFATRHLHWAVEKMHMQPNKIK